MLRKNKKNGTPTVLQPLLVFFADASVSPSGFRSERFRKIINRSSHKSSRFWADIFSPVSGRHLIAGPTYFRDNIFPGPHDIRWFFSTWFFADGFLFPVKELGFWTNPGHWVRVLDAAGSYMYIVL